MVRAGVGLGRVGPLAGALVQHICAQKLNAHPRVTIVLRSACKVYGFILKIFDRGDYHAAGIDDTGRD